VYKRQVEAVLDESDDDEVLVKWVGYSETTWEPLGEIPNNVYNKYLRTKTTKRALQKMSRMVKRLVRIREVSRFKTL
jgi:hypothetical protein